MDVTHIADFERFFRLAAGLDVDKWDLRRYGEFVEGKTFDLLLLAQAAAKANARDVIEPFDLPITKGLQESIHAYRKIRDEADIEIEPALRTLVKLPPLDLAYSEEVETRMPEIAGGLSYALACTFKIVNPDLKNPQYRDWEVLFKIFDLLL